MAQAGERYLAAAREAAGWIAGAERRTERGLAWLPEPDSPERAATVTAPATIYSGGAGVVLFLIELARATGDGNYLAQARAGADEVAATWRDILAFPSIVPVENMALTFNMGLGGAAFALASAWQATGEARYRGAALAIANEIAAAARPDGAGVSWVGAASAGLGDGSVALFLLWAARALGEPGLRDLALRAGEPILRAGEPDPRGGTKWLGFDAAKIGLPAGSYMPNFEFGTAGVAYVLARLYEEGGDERFLAAARSGAEHVQALATSFGDASLLFYREPDLTDLYYLGYCHGPAGTARTFYQLFRVTGEPGYLEWAERFARGVVAAGAPEQQSPGLWNVVCQCCGTAGIADFFVSMWAATGKAEYLGLARRSADELLARGEGGRWEQAWTRTQPDAISAETGYMIGAAGVGSALVHVALAERGQYEAILFPDNPFPARA